MFGRLAMGFANVRAGTRVLMLVLVQAGASQAAAGARTVRGDGQRGGPVQPLRVFPLFAFISRAQGSSGAVATMPFVWRSHAKSPTTRAGRALDIALRLE